MKDDNILKVDGLNYHLVTSRAMSFWNETMSSLGHYHNSTDFGNKIPLQYASLTLNGTESHIFLPINNFEKYKDNIATLLSDQKRMKQVENTYKKFARSFLQSLNKVVKKPTPDNWQNFTEEYTRFCAGLFLTFAMGQKGVTLLSHRLRQNKFTDTEIRSLLGPATYPDKHTPLFDSQIALLKIGALTQKKRLSASAVQKLLQQWLDDYEHIPVNFCGEPWTMRDAKQQLKANLRKDCQSELRTLKQNHINKVKQAKVILKQVSDPKVSTLAHSVQLASYLNEFRKQIFCKVSLGIRPAFSIVARREKLRSWRDCFYLMPQEISRVLAGEKINAKKIIATRSIVAIKITAQGRQVFISPKDTQRMAAIVRHNYGQEGEALSVQEVSGTPVNAGVVRGHAKIVLNAKDFAKFKPGDILIAPYTSVDYIPLMKQAAAFVTNQGGLTSHAAIVSREMNKPCIVNTKIGTQVFKDGDLVEVDANRGVVRKLKKL